MNRARLTIFFVFCLLSAAVWAQRPATECDEILRQAQKLAAAGQLSDAMLTLDAVTTCDKANLLQTRVTNLRIAINNEILRRDSLLKIEQKNVRIQQNINRFRSSLLYSDLAQTAIANKDYNSAWLYLARAIEDSLSDKAKTLLIQTAMDHYTFKEQLPFNGSAGYTCIAMHPTKKILVAGSIDSSIIIRDYSAASPDLRIKIFAGNIAKLAFSRDGSTLAVGAVREPDIPVIPGHSGTHVLLLSTDTWEVLTRDSFVNAYCRINDLVFAGNNRQIALASSCGVRLIDFSTHSHVQLLKNGAAKVAYCGGNLFAALIGDFLYLADSTKHDQPEQSILLQPFTGVRSSGMYSTGALAPVPGVHKLLIGLITGNFVEYNWDTGQVLPLPFSQLGSINDIRFLNDNQFLACSSDNTVSLWDYSAHRLIEKFSNGRYGFTAVSTGTTHALTATLEPIRPIGNIEAGKVKVWEKNLSPGIEIAGKYLWKSEFSGNSDSLLITYSDTARYPPFQTPNYTASRRIGISLKNLSSMAHIEFDSLPKQPENRYSVPDEVRKRFPFLARDKAQFAGLALSPNGKYLLLRRSEGGMAVLETAAFNPVGGMFHTYSFGLPDDCAFSAGSRYLGCLMGSKFLFHDFKRNRNDTIATTDQIFMDFSFVDDPPLVVLTDIRHNIHLFRLTDNFEEMCTIYDMPLFRPTADGKSLLYQAADGLHFTSVNFPLSVRDAQIKTNLKLRFNNELVPLDP